MIDGLPDDLPDQIVWLIGRVKDLESRFRNRTRTGTIHEIDLDTGLARVKLGEGENGPFLTGWIPWKEISSGKIKTSFNPSVGEQVDVTSTSGDLTDATIEMSSPSNKNKRPHAGVEAVIECEGGRVEIGKTVSILAPSKATIAAPEIELVGDIKTTGSISNNSVNIGHDHKHEDVTIGGDKSGPPSE